ncbi:hypothetical protein F4824DRAFT_498071 [Ustulina deusta]|nr:hypothetical protein F4824DRAFT_498071 [Ustulina deusta]
MKFFPILDLAASLSGTTQAHSIFSTIFISGANQGDGKCLRTSFTIDKIANPITDLDSPEMACGIVGQTSAPDTCRITAGASSPSSSECGCRWCKIWISGPQGRKEQLHTA